MEEFANVTEASLHHINLQVYTDWCALALYLLTGFYCCLDQLL